MLDIELIGTDGSVWDLRRGPIKLSDKGIAGLSTGTYSAQTSTTANSDGQALGSWNENPRSVLLPVRFRTDDVNGIQRQFWEALSLYGPLGPYCTLRVTPSTDMPRELSMRFTDDGGVPLRIDPELTGNDIYPLAFVADNPWWLGDEIITQYSKSDDYLPGFFGDGNGAPPFNIIDSSPGAGGAYVYNPGDVPAWPVIEAEGPMTRFYTYMGTDSALIDYIGIIGAGETVYVYTDPLEQHAELDGVSVLRNFASLGFTPIGTSGGTSVTIGVYGTGRARVRFRPKYRRAY